MLAAELIDNSMTSELKPYPVMKDSGVPWLGDVPEQWEVWQIGHFAAVGNGSTPSRGNAAYWTKGNHPWLNSRSVNAGTVVQADQFVTDTALRECHLPRVPIGSVLVAITGQGKTRGTAAVLKIEATINQHIAFIAPRSTRRLALPDYLRAFLVAAYPELRRMSDDAGSTKGALTCEDLRRFRVALPPLNEQAAIARFLDCADRRIRRYIRVKQELIRLLEEQLIVRAAEAMRHPRCVTERLERLVVQHLRSIARDGTQIYVALGLYNRGRGIFHKKQSLGAELGDSTFFWVEPGDLVISGQFAWEGAVALASAAEKDKIVSHRYYLLRGIEGRSTTPYLWALLRSDLGRMLLDQHSRGAAGRNRPLNLRALLKEHVPVPPFEEQLALNALVQSLAPVRQEAALGISLVGEYRARLIADIVTGKLDVREAVAGLPDDIEEPELSEVVDGESDSDEPDELDTAAEEAEV